MKRINITRDGNGNVKFDEVFIDNTENVFFINEDPEEEHWPSIAANKLGRAPSLPSSQCHPTPDPNNFKPKIYYECKINGHANERGIINIFKPLSKADSNLELATQGQQISPQPVVEGGKSPYKISDQLYEVHEINDTDSTTVVIQSGLGVGPGLQLTATPDNNGISLSGAPEISGIYIFTFTVDDGMGSNLQQVQWEMIVEPPAA